MKKTISILTPLMLLLAGCGQATVTSPPPIASTAPDLHFANATGDKFAMTLVESEDQIKKFPALQDQLARKVIVDLPLIPGSTADDGPWKGSFGGVYNIFAKRNQMRYDAPVSLAQAKQWFQKEMVSEGYKTFGSGPDFTIWQYGSDPNLEVDINLLDEGTGKTLVEYGVSDQPVLTRPSSLLLPSSVSKVEIKVTDDKNATKSATLTNPDDLKKIVALYNELPVSGDDGNHSEPDLPNATVKEILFTDSDGNTVKVSEDPHLRVQSGGYFFFDKEGEFSKLTAEFVK